MKVCDWGAREAGGIPSVEVTCVNIRGNTGGAGGVLDCK